MPTDMSGITSQNRTNQTDASNSGKAINAVFADPKDQQVTIDDFLQLMAAQLSNQDFMNPVDDTQYMAQLAQFTTLQQMEEMAYNSKTTFSTSLVGKNVVAAKINAAGNLKRTEGMVEKVSFVDNKFLFYIKGEAFSMDQIMEVSQKAATVTPPTEDSSSGNNNNGSGDSGSGQGNSGDNDNT